MIALVWQAIGYYMVMYMASMANVPESFMSRRLWKAREDQTVLYDHNSADLDKHQNNTYILRYQYDQYEFPACKSNDKRRTGRSVKCILKLYVSGSVLQHLPMVYGMRSVLWYSSSRLHLREF